MENLTLGDDHASANAMVHFPWGSIVAEAEIAAQFVSPGDEGVLGPALKFSLSNCPFCSPMNKLVLMKYLNIVALVIEEDVSRKKYPLNNYTFGIEKKINFYRFIYFML